MFKLSHLPDMVFLAPDGSEQILHLSLEQARIRSVAIFLRQSCSPGSAIGLMYPSEPNLAINWIACLLAGLRPLILQYPNKKQNRGYWEDSVRNTIKLVALDVILVESSQKDLQLNSFVRAINQSELDSVPTAAEDGLDFTDFEVLQLSSGTTGYRKAISLRSEELLRHVTDFNETLGLSRSDVIVSWLPLYHDMGFIACFVMPLALGVNVVMMDPVSWVQNPDLLFNAIERYAGTVCYMPNFGYEVMARASKRPQPSMRWWVSCSEPVSARTALKFLDHTQTPPDRFAPCYAMAENIFAVSFGCGVRTASIGGVDVVSCGAPIAGVDIKIVDDQVWVRSPTSLERYIGGDDIRDADGFYPTGDLGELIDGELYITGRKHDLMIQAGRKFMLSDIDIRVNEILPEARGRAACVAIMDPRIETEIACVLIEAPDFFRRTDQTQIENQLKAVTGIDQITVQFVPPRFLTKTTSGKINRKKSLADWLAVQVYQQRSRATITDTVHDLEAAFCSVAWDKPVSAVLDSLSLTLLQMLTSEGGITYNSDDTLAVVRERLRQAIKPTATTAEVRAIRVVSIAERLLFDDLTEEHLATLGEILGVPVTFEHVCVPPTAILLSDLVFSDYFQPRLDQENFAAVDRALNKIRNASVIIVDDASEMFYPPEQIYGVLSHNMERDPRTDFISVRWQNYSQMHDRLPLTVVRGGDIALADSSKSIAALSDYLSTPVFRIANFRGFQSFTEGWEWRPLRGHSRAFDPDVFVQTFGEWLGGIASGLRSRPLGENLRLDLSDAIHFCSHAIKKAPIDLLLENFDRFCVAGRPASLPYIRNRLAEMGKPLTYLPSYAPEIVKAAPNPFDCILICGSMGNFDIELPAVAFQHVGQSWRTKNLEQFGEKFMHLNTHGSMEDHPESGRDWFYCGDLAWGQNREEWTQVRLRRD